MDAPVYGVLTSHQRDTPCTATRPPHNIERFFMEAGPLPERKMRGTVNGKPEK